MSSFSAKITFYDLARRVKPNRCWSYNAWKTRLVLNYKKIPYTTAWVNHDTIGPTLEAIGIRANASEQGFPYTVPTIQLPGKAAITDSAVIVTELESLYPFPALNLDSDLQNEADRVTFMTCMPLFAIYMPEVARSIIEESTVPTFNNSREKRFGMTLEELERARGGEQAWKAAEPGMSAMKNLLTSRKMDEGPFILGSQVCYADFILVASLETLRKAGNGMFERFLEWDSCFRDLYEACLVWFENDQ
ncbi:Glutathione S-transferase-like protein ustS [Colletotrichum orbiculare MAFF 240422]|uniref:Glutathione S-transferase-like protein ustS n=1 Tax=Colletotrichum orbiculare (strain 104-T / ATCC 96160 / CBS 514.97 / LARS 414 / MAFF 240422) TaxID=1213857 RepID=N4VBA7_COLOR|nr:Glutathione S-transferase-like protein ustS [Colletotrichum orbiculare MAFF 240422]